MIIKRLGRFLKGKTIVFRKKLKKIIFQNYLYLFLNNFNYFNNRIKRFRSSNKIVIDGGVNLLQGFEQMFNKKIINKEFECYLFEPNPNCIPIIKNKLSNETYSEMKIQVIQKALSDENNIVNLRLETVPGEHRLQYTDEVVGYDTKLGGGSSILGTEWIKPGWIDEKNFSDVQVEALKTSEFILNSLSRRDYIVLKLDVEGAEFKIIEDLLKNNILKYFNEAYIEWHPQNNSHYTNNDVKKFKKSLIRKGIFVGFWL